MYTGNGDPMHYMYFYTGYLAHGTSKDIQEL